MPRKLFRSIAAAATRNARDRAAAAPSHFEQLEPRILFSASGPAFIENIFADNRGFVTMDVCGDLDGDTVNGTSVQAFTAGEDNLFGTFDDVLLDLTVGYNAGNNRILMQADVDAGTRYGIRLDASIIRGVNGFLLDGEFNGSGMPTGDGLSGGDTLFYAKTAVTQVARITTNLGDIDIELFTEDTPITVMNFLNYANSGRYDEVIFHRSINDFVIQAGGFRDTFGFGAVEKFDPIQNEPGISNTRGTIAFAKSPNNPNSATSEWFFNLGDNSENLDNQNGGFTVFGEIINDSGLDVMDAIAALETVDASGVNGAFTDFPVTDIDAISGNPGAISPAVSVSILRVAVMQELSATPPEQIQAESFTFASNRDVFVTVYDLGGIGRDEIENVVDVKFSGNRVSSITINGGIPAGSLGLVVGDANRVGTIKDRGDDSSVAFIFSNAEVGSVKLKGEITGFNINGLNLGGVLLSDDVDNDGVFNDETAILINSGYTDSVVSDGDITGDVLLPGGVGSLALKGSVTDSDIRIGAAPTDLAEAIKIQIGDAHRAMLDSADPIDQLRVDSWTVDTDTENTTIDAPSIAKLQLDGAFDADVTLSGATEPDTETLGKLTAKNGLFGANFDITGGVDSINVKGDTAQIRLEASGTIGKIKLDDLLASTIRSNGGAEISSVKIGAITDSNLNFEDEVSKFSAGSFDGGDLSMLAVQKLKITDRDGVFNPDVQIGRGFGFADDVAGSITINSEVTGGVWSVAGNVDKFKIQDGRDAEFLIRGSVKGFDAGDLTRFDLAVEGEADKVNTGTWFRGDLTFGNLGVMDINGDFRADLFTTNARRINITGDLFISDLFFSQQPDFAGTYSLQSLTVGGEMSDVEFRAAFRVGDIQAKAMHNTIIGVSNSIPNNSFPTPGDVDQFSSIDSVIITGSRNGPPNFTDSYIIAALVDEVVLGNVDPFNSGRDFGIGAFQLNSLTYFADGEEISLRNNALSESPEPFGDFEVRINFLRFNDTGA